EANAVSHHPDGAGLLTIAKDHRNLRDAQRIHSRREQALEVKAESGYPKLREDAVSRGSGKTLEPCLRVTKTGKKYRAHDCVQDPAHQMPRIHVVKESRTYHVKRFRKHTAGDGYVAAGLQCGDDLADLPGGVCCVRIYEDAV